jgi:hypothetical protein
VKQETVHEQLKVEAPASWKIANYLTPESVAYYAQLGLDESFALSMVPDWVHAAGPFSPVPLQPSEIAQLFVNDKLDYDVMVNFTAAGGPTVGNDEITPSQCTVQQCYGYNRPTAGYL